MLYAKTAEEYTKLVRPWAGYSGPFNHLFATANGDIGFIPLVAHPTRKYNVGQGSHPKKGWIKGTEWGAELVPLNELPYIVNPPKGYIISTNNRLTVDQVKHGISFAMSMSTRYIRLEELLTDRIKAGQKFNYEIM